MSHWVGAFGMAEMICEYLRYHGVIFLPHFLSRRVSAGGEGMMAVPLPSPIIPGEGFKAIFLHCCYRAANKI